MNEHELDDEVEGQEEEVISLENGPPKKRLYKFITFIIIILIVIGLVAHLVLVYFAAQALELKDKEFNKIEKLSTIEYEVTFTLTLENPTDTEIEIEKITYEAYLEGEYLGNGEKIDLFIDPGVKNYVFKFEFNILDLPGAVRQLFLDLEATLKITGSVTIPAKFFGVWKFTEITVEYEIIEEVSASPF